MKDPASISIVTAAWSTALPDGVVRVGISRGPPRRRRGYRMCRSLAPGPWFRSIGEQEYIERYSAQLALLDPHEILKRLTTLAGGTPIIALLCFERPLSDDGWCHRSLTARWLERALAVRVPEWGFAHLSPEEHPLLPTSMRAKQ